MLRSENLILLTVSLCVFQSLNLYHSLKRLINHDLKILTNGKGSSTYISVEFLELKYVKTLVN